jgi:hypothetical protein
LSGKSSTQSLKDFSGQSLKDLLKYKLGLTGPIIDRIIKCNLGKKDLLDILDSLDKNFGDEYKKIVGAIRTSIKEERKLNTTEKTIFMNMTMGMNMTIFKNLLGQIKNQKCQEGIMGNMPKTRSRFAAAAEECPVCTEEYTIKHNTDREIENCYVEECRAPVELSSCKHTFCHSCVAELTKGPHSWIICPLCRRTSKSPSLNTGEREIVRDAQKRAPDRSNRGSSLNYPEIAKQLVFVILFIVLYALSGIGGPRR